MISQILKTGLQCVHLYKIFPTWGMIFKEKNYEDGEINLETWAYNDLNKTLTPNSILKEMSILIFNKKFISEKDGEGEML